ncbi:helix-turn-helix domain-containing protein [Blautia parvula]|nr:helix-turn-helix domain-containing protein [Blautia parvula]
MYIENSLCKGYTFKDIAKYLGIDSTTISKEVKTHCFSD